MYPKNAEYCVFDLDGVLADIVKGAQKYVDYMYGRHVPDTWIGHDLDAEELEEMLTNEEFFAFLPPIKNAPKALKTIEKLDYKIIIVTGRKIPIGPSVSWLIDRGIPFHDVVPMNKKDRVDLAKQINPLLFVEDNYETAKNVKEYCYKTLVLAHPWNDFKNPDITIIRDLMDLFPYIGVEVCQKG